MQDFNPAGNITSKQLPSPEETAYQLCRPFGIRVWLSYLIPRIKILGLVMSSLGGDSAIDNTNISSLTQ